MHINLFKTVYNFLLNSTFWVITDDNQPRECVHFTDTKGKLKGKFYFHNMTEKLKIFVLLNEETLEWVEVKDFDQFKWQLMDNLNMNDYPGTIKGL